MCEIIRVHRRKSALLGYQSLVRYRLLGFDNHLKTHIIQAVPGVRRQARGGRQPDLVVHLPALPLPRHPQPKVRFQFIISN